MITETTVATFIPFHCLAQPRYAIAILYDEYVVPQVYLHAVKVKALIGIQLVADPSGLVDRGACD